MKKRPLLRSLLAAAFALIGFALLILVLTLPNPTNLGQCLTTSLYKVELCSTNKNYVPLKQISPMAVAAVLVSEDAGFFRHPGVDWEEIQNSFLINWQSGRYVRGGSTLTQQLAKNVYLDGSKSLWRKLKELILTVQIEGLYDKNTILEKYLNVVEFGPDIYGINKASRFYFDKAPSSLNALEAAYLAHLLPNPRVYSQGYRKGKLTDYSEKRVRWIVRQMGKGGYIDRRTMTWAEGHVPEFPWRALATYKPPQAEPQTESFPEIGSSEGTPPEVEPDPLSEPFDEDADGESDFD